MPENGYNTINFSKGSIGAVEAVILTYNIKDSPFGYSFRLRGVYDLGDGSMIGRMPRPSQKRKTEYHIDAARKKGAVFIFWEQRNCCRR